MPTVDDGTLIRVLGQSRIKVENCHFALYLVEFVRGQWGVRVEHGMQNHDMIDSLKGHAYRGYLNDDDYNQAKVLIVVDRTTFIVNFFGHCTDRTHWMEIPTMGFVFVTLYQRPSVVLLRLLPMMCL